MVSPLGLSAPVTWKNLIQGQTGIGVCVEGNGPVLAARVLGFSPNGARSRMGDFAILAAKEALLNAGFEASEWSEQSIGCAISQSKPVLANEWGPFKLSPDLLLSGFSGWSSENVVQRSLGLKGPAANVAAACATGVAAIQQSIFWLWSGECELVLAGASESSLNPLYWAGFENMGALVDAGDPKAARPFDKFRSGFSIGEGAAVMLLEKEDSLRTRGAKPLAFIKNVRMMHNPTDTIRFDEDGDYVARLILNVLRDSKKLDYINAHGTGTHLNDLQETRGIKKALGPEAYNIPISSTKAATGHMLGAAGAIEAAFCALAIHDQIIPPTLNLTTPDPDCDLDYVPHFARKKTVQTAMSLSYGFGGQMGAVIFERN